MSQFASDGVAETRISGIREFVIVQRRAHTSYAAAISDVLATLDGKLYTGLNTTNTIFQKCSTNGGPQTLDDIYTQLGGASNSNVRAARCPD